MTSTPSDRPSRRKFRLRTVSVRKVRLACGLVLFTYVTLHFLNHALGSISVAAMERGQVGEVYNFGASSERHNIDIVKQVLRLVGKPESLIQYVKDRLGHDRRYAIDSSKAQAKLGWKPRHVFEEALAATVRWYVENRPWWERIISGEYLKYYEKQYGGR